MPHMLPVSTAQISYPMTFIILVIPDNILQHEGSLAALDSPTFITRRPRLSNQAGSGPNPCLRQTVLHCPPLTE